MQNFAAGGFSVSQLGQTWASPVPHDMQKRAVSGFAVLQAGQARVAIAFHHNLCAVPDFLDLPERPAKPRSEGVTHVIDTGLSRAEAEGLVASAREYVDLVRLGWGSAYVTHDLREKLDVYRGAGIPAMLGGTFTELVWLRGRVDPFRAWLSELGIEHVEVSSGTVPMPEEAKLDLIRTLAEDFVVYAEVGEKDPNALMAPYRWVELIKHALDAGAVQVVCEGRATGDAGLFRPDGEPRTGLIDEIAHELDTTRLIFEAPQKAQQVWFIQQFGSHVNLGNVLPGDVISLESLRLGLRADTLKLFHERG
jgi:phosphosulfolactate synthase